MDDMSKEEHLKHVWAMAVLKAWQDEDFKAALLADAHDALKRAFDYDLPAGISLRVVDAQQAQPIELTLMLPPKPPAKDTADVLFTFLTDRGGVFVPC